MLINHPQLLKRNIYVCLYLCFWSLEVKYLCKCNMYYCTNTSLFTGGSSTHKTSVCVRTGILRCPDGHRPICYREDIFYVLGARQTSYDVRLGTVRFPVVHRWNRTIIFLNKNRPVSVRCVQSPAGRRPGTVQWPGTVRAPYSARPMSFYPQ